MMHPIKIENILKLDNDERYNYLIEKVADFEVIFLIYGNFNNAYTLQFQNKECSLIFPEKEFAERFISDKEKVKVKAINIYKYIQWLENDQENNLRFAAFPSDNHDAKIVNSKTLKKHIIDACEQYE